MADDPTVPGAPVGFNGVLSIGRYGKKFVRVTGISYGLDVVSAEDEMRDDRAFYTLNVVESDFDLFLTFISMNERKAISDWLTGWAKAVSANANVSGYIKIDVPTRNFTRRAVLETGVVYGDAVGTTSYPMALRFVGAADPTSAIGKSDVAGDSFLEAASRDTTAAPFFYPSYYVHGATGDKIYDNPVVPVSPVNPKQHGVGLPPLGGN